MDASFRSSCGSPTSTSPSEATDPDGASGIVRLTGNSWHLRTTDGKIVQVLSGLEQFVRATGEVIRATPLVGRGFENLICPALGGSPA